MYFMSIDDFELLGGAISSGAINLTEILEHAVKCDRLWETKKFTFGQHLHDRCPKLQAPAWLLDESKRIIECCRLRFNSKT